MSGWLELLLNMGEAAQLMQGRGGPDHRCLSCSHTACPCGIVCVPWAHSSVAVPWHQSVPVLGIRGYSVGAETRVWAQLCLAGLEDVSGLGSDTGALGME